VLCRRSAEPSHALQLMLHDQLHHTCCLRWSVRSAHTQPPRMRSPALLLPLLPACCPCPYCSAPAAAAAAAAPAAAPAAAASCMLPLLLLTLLLRAGGVAPRYRRAHLMDHQAMACMATRTQQGSSTCDERPASALHGHGPCVCPYVQRVLATQSSPTVPEGQTGVQCWQGAVSASPVCRSPDAHRIWTHTLDGKQGSGLRCCNGTPRGMESML
jgi:hypothetical protein